MGLVTQADVEANNAIDLEILRYTRLIRALGTRRNTHIAINKLPNELLSRIFKTAEDMARQETRNQDNITTLLLLKSVCSRWSHVALETPDLWSTISLSQRAWVAEAFQRSKQAPLTIIGPLANLCFDEKSEVLLSKLLSATPRIVKLDLMVTSFDRPHRPRDPLNLLQKYTRDPSPLLRTLNIAYEGPQHNFGGMPDDELHAEVYYGFGPTLIRFPWSDMRSLRTMNLKNIVPFAVPSMPCLTHLILNIKQSHIFDEGYESPSEMLFSVPRVVDILHSTPVVENVSLSIISTNVGTVPVVPYSTPADSPPLSLPNLRKLRLECAKTQEANLFARLDLPALRETSLSYKNRRSDPAIQGAGDIASLRRQVSRCVPSDAGPLKVTVTTPARDRRELQYEVKVVEDSDARQPVPILELKITAFPRTEQHTQIVESLPLGKITNLTLVGVKEPDQVAAWSNVIPLLINLKHISVEKVQVLQRLGFNVAGQNDVTNVDLETVMLTGGALDSSDDWESVISTCRFRHEQGKTIPKVSADSLTGLIDEWAGQLAGYVAILEFPKGCVYYSDGRRQYS